MDFTEQDVLRFFDRNLAAWPLYQAFERELFARLPDTKRKVQKTQIAFSNRYLFACVSFLRVKKKAELPDPYFVLTLGLPAPLASERVAEQTESYPGRWTVHLVIGAPDELDGELFGWVEQAYQFAETNGKR